MNDFIYTEDNETIPSSPLRRLFSLKRGPSEKKKMIQNVLGMSIKNLLQFVFGSWRNNPNLVVHTM